MGDVYQHVKGRVPVKRALAMNMLDNIHQVKAM